ncbi:MAG: LamG domain-containing protein [Candidatus Poribacteria bacterium]|nr:LamG domain-containing protein [Candidatus Poribacteria bacterium]
MPKVICVLSLCLLLMIANFSVANVAEDGLVAYWPFDEGKGKEAIDVTGNGHDGEFNSNPKWVEGKFGTGLEFDGEDDYVIVADDPALAIEENITFMAWFSPNDILTKRRLMVKNNSIFVIFDFGNADSIDFLVKPNNTFAESTTTDWKVGKWYHFAGTFDGKTMKVYVNGELEGEAANDVPIAPSNLELWIGGDDFGRPTDSFPGKIDEVRLYEKTLSEDDIQKVMEIPQDVEARGKLTATWGNLKAGIR